MLDEREVRLYMILYNSLCNIIQIHNNVLRDVQYECEEYFAKYW